MRVIKAGNIEFRQISSDPIQGFKQILDSFNALHEIPVDQFISSLNYDSRLDDGFQMYGQEFYDNE